MYDNDSKGISYTAGFFMLIAFVVAGSVAAELISNPIWKAMTGKSVQDLIDGNVGPADSTAMKLKQSITAVFGFFIPTIITAALLHRKPLHLIGFKGYGRPTVQQVGLSILILGVSLLAASSLSYLMHFIPVSDALKLKFSNMELDYGKQIAAIINLQSTADYLVALVVLAFLPALCEETVFRGGLQNFLSRGTGKPWLAIVLVSILFSLAHYSFYLFLSRFLLGLVLGAVFHYSGKLWLSVLLHFINNALTLTILFVYIRKGHTLEEAMQVGEGNIWGIFALPLLIALLYMFRRVTFKPRTA